MGDFQKNFVRFERRDLSWNLFDSTLPGTKDVVCGGRHRFKQSGPVGVVQALKGYISDFQYN